VTDGQTTCTNLSSRESHTETVRGVARAPPALPEVLLRWTMRERRVLVPDLAEEVHPIRTREQRRAYRVYGRIAPTLFCPIFQLGV
jgi:hypothetical protein